LHQTIKPDFNELHETLYVYLVKGSLKLAKKYCSLQLWSINRVWLLHIKTVILQTRKWKTWIEILKMKTVCFSFNLCQTRRGKCFALTSMCRRPTFSNLWEKDWRDKHRALKRNRETLRYLIHTNACLHIKFSYEFSTLHCRKPM